MNSLLGYNHVKGDWKQHVSKTTWNVAIVFGKCLVRDQVTVEYASRIRTLAKLFKKEPSFRPSLVVFCGSTAEGNLVSDADAGYIFFRHMCEAQDIDLSDVKIFIDTNSRSDAEAVQRVTFKVKKLLPTWFEKVPEQVELTQDRYLPRKVISVHFSFISTEYHLCNINDIHHRSPRQSVLNSIEQLQEEITKSNFAHSYTETKRSPPFYDSYNSRIEDEENDNYFHSEDELKRHTSFGGLSTHDDDDTPIIRGDVKTSWSFQYATYPYIHSNDEAVAYLGKCYLLGEELMPLLVNLKGVVQKVNRYRAHTFLLRGLFLSLTPPLSFCVHNCRPSSSNGITI
jgi:hypothetical protein